jgi:MYXO-CTERM domain-containing protein
MKTACTLAGAAAALTLSTVAQAGYSIVQGPSAPSYSQTLTFDGQGPTGNNLPQNSWAAFGVASIFSGEGSNSVLDQSTNFPWLTNTTNSYWGPFGVNIEFGYEVSSASLQAWDNGGPPSPIGGGSVIRLKKNNVEVGSLVYTGAWGGVGNPWFNITTTGGDTFDSIVVFGNTFGFPQTIVDNISWNAVPTPGALALLGLAGIVGRRRRRG